MTASSQPTPQRNPPVDYAVAVWLGTAKSEIEKGLREGYIRAPFGVDLRAWMEERGFAAETLGTGQGSVVPSPSIPAELGDTQSQNERSGDLRARIETLLRGLDPGLEAQTFSAAWEEAGHDDASRAQRLAGFIGSALGMTDGSSADFGAALARLEAAVAGIDGDGRFVRFAAMSGRALESLAASDGGVRRSLVEHAPWAFTGDRGLARRADPSGRYDRFDPDSGESLLSDAWLGDRSKHAAWRSAAASGHPLDIDGDGWRFVDRAAGDTVSVELTGTSDQPPNQVIFARDDGDRVSGAAGTDRIHGGRGDDLLRGRGGDDLLEGGSGEDALQGGRGRDHLDGQQGNDDLDGGQGNDRLEGGAGDDELSGDRGDDVLRGGTGDDVYRFEGGDGLDTIEDTGGVVIFDDVTLSGTMRRDGEGWRSGDGRFRFALEPQGDTNTLVIRSLADGEHAANHGTVRIAHWTPGSFGIALAAMEDDTGESEAAPNPVDGAATAEEGAAGIDAAGHEADEAPWPPIVRENDYGQGAPTRWPDFVDVLPPVEASMVEQALAAWAPRSPPYVDFLAQSPVGVTAADVGNAIVDVGGDTDSDAGTAPVALEPWSVPSLPVLAAQIAPDAPRTPPPLFLRSPS